MNFYENDFEIIEENETEFMIDIPDIAKMNREPDKKDYYEYNLIYENDSDLCFKKTDIICIYFFNKLKFMLKTFL
tara:strand:- start:428 stop:652 length:225 start_codon:yes stop_codon:yes gene_type:complete